MTHRDLIRKTIAELAELGIEGRFPNLDVAVEKEQVELELMQQLESDHFAAIDNSQGLYCICPDGKVGTLVSVEIGYAKGQRKPVIFSEQPQDLGLRALADAIITLTDLGRLKAFPP